MEKKLIICSSRLNRYGYRVLASGIETKHYLKNPILLSFHDGKVMSVGKITDLKVEKDEDGYDILTGVPEFDLDDPHAAHLDRKFKKGYMNACSMGFNPIDVSEDPELLELGQTLGTVTKSELLEVSITNIPGDRDAVGVPLKLSAEGGHLERLKILSNTKIEEMDLSKICKKLGLAESATETEVINKIESLQLSYNALETERIEALVKLGKESGVVTDANEASIRSLAKLDYENASKMVTLSAMKREEKKDEKPADAKSVAATIKELAADGIGKKTDAEGLTFEKLSKEDPDKLAQIRTDDPALYEKLAADYVKSQKNFII